MTDSKDFTSILADLALMSKEIAATARSLQVVNPADGIISAALEEIKTTRNNRIRCALTGAPVATIDDNEIRAYLCAQSDAKAVTFDYLLDQWSLNLFALSSRPGPALQNRKVSSLDHMIRNVTDWAPRLIAFYLTSFAFGFRKASQGDLINHGIRKQSFAADWYDFAATEKDQLRIESAASRLAACDAWFALSDWHSLGFMSHVGNTKVNGIKSPRHLLLRALSLVPDSVEMTIDNLMQMVDSLIKLMMTATDAGAVDGRAVGEQSRRVLDSLSSAITKHNIDPTGYFEKKAVVVRDPIALAQAEQEYSGRMAELHGGKRVHSVTHGKGYLPGAAGPTTKSDKAARSATKPKRVYKPSGAAKATADAMAKAIAAMMAENIKI